MIFFSILSARRWDKTAGTRALGKALELCLKIKGNTQLTLSIGLKQVN